MNLLLAYTLELNLATLLVLAGAGLLCVSFFISNPNNARWAAVAGVVLLVGGFLFNSPTNIVPPNPNPAPNPLPGPTPNPTPQPAYFATEIAAAFQGDGGTKENAAILAAAFIQMAETITFDGELGAEARIQSLPDLGSSFARLQRNRFLMQDTPLKDKFPKVQLRMSTEMAVRGLKDGTFDQAKRAAAAAMFREAGEAIKAL